MTIPFTKERAVGSGWYIKPGVKVRGLPSAEAFGTPLVAIWQTMTVSSGIPSGEAVGIPGFVYNQFLTNITGIPSAEAFGGSSSAPGPVNIGLQAIPSGEAFGTPVIGRGSVNIGVAGIDDTGSQMGVVSVANPPNIMLDPTFELGVPNYADGGSGRTTEQAYSGSYSYKLVIPPTSYSGLYFFRNFNGVNQFADVAVGDAFYVEYMIKAKIGNTSTGVIYNTVWEKDAAGANILWNVVSSVAINQIPNSSWMKVSYVYRVKNPDVKTIAIHAHTSDISTGNVPGDSVYIDDVQVVRTQEIKSPSADNLATDPYCENPAMWVGSSQQDFAVISENGETFVRMKKPATQPNSFVVTHFIRNTSGIDIVDTDIYYNQRVTARARVRRSPGGPNVNLRLSFRHRDSGGTLMGNQNIVNVILNHDDWVEFETTSYIPLDCVSTAPGFYVGNVDDPLTSWDVDWLHYEKEWVQNPIVENQIAPLSILDEGDIITDPQILRPELWKTATGCTIEVVQEDGENALLVTKTAPAGSYPQIHLGRNILGNGTGAGTQNVSPGDALDFSFDVKAHPDNPVFSAANRMFIQANITDTNGVNPTLFAGTTGLDQVAAQWRNHYRINYVIPQGYNQITAILYMIHTVDPGYKFFIKNLKFKITPTTTTTVVRGPVNISFTGIPSQEAMGGSAVAPGAAAVLPFAIPSGEVFGATGVGASQPLVAPPISDEVFEDWENSDPFFDISVVPRANYDTTVSYSGTRSIKIDPEATGTSYTLIDGKFKTFDVVEGDKIKASVRCRRSPDYNGDDAKIRIGENHSGGTPVDSGGWCVFSASTMTTPDAWYYRENTVTIPAGITRVGFNLRSRASAGYLWLDDIRIEKISVSEPGLSVGPVDVAPSAFDDGSAVGTPAIGRGAVNLSPPSADDGNIWSTPTVTRGDVDIATVGIDDSAIMGTPTITVATSIIAPTGFDDGFAVGSPIVIPDQNLAITGFDDAYVIGTASIGRGAVGLIPVGIDDGDSQAGTPSLFLPQVTLESAGPVNRETHVSNTSHTVIPTTGPVVPAKSGTGVLVLIMGYKTSNADHTISMTYGGSAMTASEKWWGNGGNSSNTSFAQWFYISTSASQATITGTIAVSGFSSPRYAVMSWSVAGCSGLGDFVWDGGTTSGTAMSIPAINMDAGSIVFNAFMQEPISGADETAPTNVAVNGSPASGYLWSGQAEDNCTGIVTAIAGVSGSRTFSAGRMDGHDWAGSAIELLPAAA